MPENDVALLCKAAQSFVDLSPEGKGLSRDLVNRFTLD